MTNIYNKKIYFPNGTLIGNWFEEDELRKKTGEGRTIPGHHLPKRSFDFQNPIEDNFPKDNTFKRVMGEKEPDGRYLTYNKEYGDFKLPEAKYIHPPLRAKKQQEIFDKFVQSSVELSKEIEVKNDELRGFTTTYQSANVPKPFESTLGQRHMYTQDRVPIPKDQPDKLFMAQHKMGKYPSVLSQAEIDGYVDRYIPYHKDKEITFWSTNLNKGNMYRSFTLGTNPFGRSHCFTQTVPKTKGAYLFYGNGKNLSTSKNVYMNDHDVNYYDTYKAEVERTEVIPDLSPEVRKVLLGNCSKKGWCGLRGLKIFLRSLSKNKSTDISKADFKFYTAKYGVNFSDIEIAFIFSRFDKNKSDHIDFIQALNSFREVSESRKSEIENFKNQVKVPGRKFISFTHLEKIADFNYHPEVIGFLKTSHDVFNEYEISWDNLKEDDLISEEGFESFFYDVSSCIQSDEDFTQCLKSCGYK